IEFAPQGGREPSESVCRRVQCESNFFSRTLERAWHFPIYAANVKAALPPIFPQLPLDIGTPCQPFPWHSASASASRPVAKTGTHRRDRPPIREANHKWRLVHEV